MRPERFASYKAVSAWANGISILALHPHERGYANRNGHAQYSSIRERHRHLLNRFAQPFGHFGRLKQFGLRQKNRKFLPTQTADKIGFAQHIGEDVPDVFKDTITDLMTIGVIHILEFVDIDHHHRRFAGIADRPRQFALGKGQKLATGKDVFVKAYIDLNESFELSSNCLAIRNILNDAENNPRLRVIGRHRMNVLDLARIRRAVLNSTSKGACCRISRIMAESSTDRNSGKDKRLTAS